MNRIPIEARPDWQAKVEALGLIFHTTDGKPYWFEGAYYELSTAEVEHLERATEELWQRCLDAVQHVLDHDRFAELAIPPRWIEPIRRSWDEEPPSIYGRFDLGFDGSSEPKLFEFNADTPTSLLEAAVVQWHWLKERAPDCDQFNWIWEALVRKWSDLRSAGDLNSATVHFASDDNAEDVMTVTVLRDTAQEAGLRTVGMLLGDIGWRDQHRVFVDMENLPIHTLFKLYPWEWLIHDSFAEHAFDTSNSMQWIEPAWKMVLSNKGILPILWELFPGHPNLLPAYFGRSRDLREWVRKPLLSREGANVTVKQTGELMRTEGDYGAEGYVFQEYWPLPGFDGNYPVVGSWYVPDVGACGIGIRESDGPVTDNWSRFVPHVLQP